MSTQIAELKTQAIEQRQKSKPIMDLIQKNLIELGKALPSHMTAERLGRIALTTVRKNPELAECTQESFLGALFQAAQLGLEPDVDGQAYFLVFNNSRKINGKWTKLKEVQFVIGYKGYVELFHRHELALKISMHTVYDKDYFDYEYGTSEFIKHKPYDTPDENGEIDRGKPIKYYAIAHLANGSCLFKVMNRTECIKHAKKHSKAYIEMEFDEAEKKYVKIKEPHFNPNSAWVTDENSMCKKTVLLQLMKTLPKSAEIRKALDMDNTTKIKILADMSESKDITNWDDKNIERKIVNE